MTYHPWRAFRARPDLWLHWRVMREHLGATNGVDLIVMHPGQNQKQRRCTMTHELVHAEHGHVSCLPDTECYARREAARRLITLGELLDVLSWTESIEEAAEELHVDMATMRDRLEALTTDERAALVARAMEVEGGC